MAGALAYARVMTVDSALRELPGCDPDARLVAAARVGDQAAFEDLVRHHEEAVYRVARRFLGDPEEAMDVCQDVFLRVYRALPRFRGDAAFRTWVLGITMNLCRTRLSSAAARRRRRTVSLETDETGYGKSGTMEVRDPAPDPEAGARGNELGKALAWALHRLSPDHREVLVLREVTGLEVDAVAAVLGCAPGTVKSRLFRARQTLRQLLEGVWP